jgi:type IV pilus assembly protein PilM
MGSVFNKTKTSSQPGGRPPAAVEITPAGVLAAVRRGGLGAGHELECAFAPLPAGALIPGIDAPNLHAPEAVSAAIRSALGEVSPRTRSVTVVLPDTTVRVFVLDFDSLPAKSAEAIPVLRFRLRKMVPFDVEHAGVSYQVLSQTKTECRVLAAILPGPVLAEYEGAVRAAGYEPGAVLPSSLAALEAVDSLEAVLIANLSGQALTTAIAAGEDLLLYRTLDLPEAPAERIAEIQRGIAVASAYFEDRLHARPSRLHSAGNYPASDVAGWIDDAGFDLVELTPRYQSDDAALVAASLAGVTGALAGVS